VATATVNNTIARKINLMQNYFALFTQKQRKKRSLKFYPIIS